MSIAKELSDEELQDAREKAQHWALTNGMHKLKILFKDLKNKKERRKLRNQFESITKVLLYCQKSK